MSRHDDAGQVFPPRDEWDVMLYDIDEVVDGYRDHAPGDRQPGANRSPAYRWGCCNRRRDSSVEDDGFDTIRAAYLRLRRNAA